MRLPVAIGLALGLALLGYLAMQTERNVARSGPSLSVPDPSPAGASDRPAPLVLASGGASVALLGSGEANTKLRTEVEPERDSAALIVHLRLLLHDGTPAADAEVWAEAGAGVHSSDAPHNGVGAGLTQEPSRDFARTDAVGRCVLRLVAGAELHLAARHPLGTLANSLLLLAGEHELELSLDRVARVFGRVRCLTTHEPIAGATVRDGMRRSTLLPAARTDAQGRFELAVTDDLALLDARADGYGQDSRRVFIEEDGSWRIWPVSFGLADLGPPGTELVLELPKAKRILGRVQEPNGAPAVGARVRVRGSLITARGVRTPDEREVQTDGDGNFAVDGLRCDITHTIWFLDGTLGAVARVAPAGGCELNLGVVELAPATELEGIAVEELPSGERLPLAGRRVFLTAWLPAAARDVRPTTQAERSQLSFAGVETRSPRDGFQPELVDLQLETNAASDGSFRFRGYAPGSLRLRAENSTGKLDIFAPPGLHVLEEPLVVTRVW